MASTTSSQTSTEYRTRDNEHIGNLGNNDVGRDQINTQTTQRDQIDTQITQLDQNFSYIVGTVNIYAADSRSNDNSDAGRNRRVSHTGGSTNRTSNSDAPNPQASIERCSSYPQALPRAQRSELPLAIVHQPTDSGGTSYAPEDQDPYVRDLPSPGPPPFHRYPTVGPSRPSRQLHELPQLVPKRRSSLPSDPEDSRTLLETPVSVSTRWYRYSPRRRLFQTELKAPSSKRVKHICIQLVYQEHAKHIRSKFPKRDKGTIYKPTSIDQNFVDGVKQVLWESLELRKTERKTQTGQESLNLLYRDKLAVVFFDINASHELDTLLKASNVNMDIHLQCILTSRHSED